MRPASLALLLSFSAALCFGQQAPSAAGPAETQQAIQTALAGEWAGYLEYRDYSEPPTSTKRVQLPTWLSVTRSPAALLLHYIYDDGPNKVVDESEQLALDTAQHTYTTLEAGHAAEVYRVEGFDALRDGHGKLILNGTGTDNDKPSEQCITMTIRRNLVEWVLEVRAAGSQDAFTFRHLFRFTRAQPPAVTAPRK
jgi:hypothetical protein